MKLEDFFNVLVNLSEGKVIKDYEIKVNEYIFDSIDYEDLDSDEIEVDHEEKTIYIK